MSHLNPRILKRKLIRYNIYYCTMYLFDVVIEHTTYATYIPFIHYFCAANKSWWKRVL